MLRLTLAGVCLLAVARPALADRFHLNTPGPKNAAAAEMDVLEGVLLKEEKGVYHIRVVGGTIEIDKKLVAKVESTALAIGQIEEQEKGAQTRLADANKQRLEVQAVDASARRSAEADAAEAAARTGGKELKVVVDFRGLLSNYEFRTYDPVLHRANLSGLTNVIESYLRDEVERAAGRK